jgi:hypothetical protein
MFAHCVSARPWRRRSFSSGALIDLPLLPGPVGSRVPVISHLLVIDLSSSRVVALQVIVPDQDLASQSGGVLEVIDEALPETVLGVPVDVPGAMNLPGDEETRHNSQGERTHGVTVTSVTRLQRDLLGTQDEPRWWYHARWLTTPRQSLLEFTAWPIFRDDVGELSTARDALAWYAHDVGSTSCRVAGNGSPTSRFTVR